MKFNELYESILNEGKSGVGQFTVKLAKKTKVDMDMGGGYEETAEDRHYIILHNGEEVGEITYDTYFGQSYGTLYGRVLPAIGGQKALHQFLKSETQLKKWGKTITDPRWLKFKELQGMKK